MDKATAETLSKKFQIAKETVVREEYEMIFLQALFSSNFHNKLVFKGGTALRLAYGSPRFSEDLDFSLLEKINNKDFAEVIKKTGEFLPAVKIKDLTEKRFTHFAFLQIKEDYLKQAFPLKIEISKRPVKWKKDVDFMVRLLKSETVGLEAIGYVVTLQRAFKDKKRMIQERQKARDWFDMWWLAQKLNKKIKMRINENQFKRFKSELNQFLPRSMRLVIEAWR